MAAIEDLAREHDVSVDAVRVLQDALRRGGGRQAQFSHPDLGGMGQWSSGGMTQVGDMFNTALKDKVNRLCAALAEHPAPAASNQAQPTETGDWWPKDLGRPSLDGGAERHALRLLPGRAPDRGRARRARDALRQRRTPDFRRLTAAKCHAGADLQQPEGDGTGERLPGVELAARQGAKPRGEAGFVKLVRGQAYHLPGLRQSPKRPRHCRCGSGRRGNCSMPFAYCRR